MRINQWGTHRPPRPPVFLFFFSCILLIIPVFPVFLALHHCWDSYYGCGWQIGKGCGHFVVLLLTTPNYYMVPTLNKFSYFLILFCKSHTFWRFHWFLILSHTLSIGLNSCWAVINWTIVTYFIRQFFSSCKFEFRCAQMASLMSLIRNFF